MRFPLIDSLLRPALACALMPCLLTSCDPSVSDIELSAAKGKLDTARAKLTGLEKEYAALQAEEKQLKTYEGPEHEAAVKRLLAMQEEKAELETIQTDIAGRIAQFEADTAKQKEAAAKLNP